MRGSIADPHGRAADRPSGIPAAGWRDIAARVRSGIRDDHVTLSAAGVAFYGFLATVPALAAVVGVLGLAVDAPRARTLVEDLFGGLPVEARQLLADQLAAVAERSTGSLSLSVVVGVLLSLWAASGAMSALVEAVGVVYGERDDRGFVKKRGLALLLTIGAVVFVIAAGFLITAVPSLLRSTDLPAAVRWVISLASWVVLAFGLLAALAVVYRTGPDRDDAEWRWVTWGSAVAVALWVVGSVGFQLYAAHLGSYDRTYGSLAAIVVLLLWLWISALAVLVGAEVNAEIEHQTSRDSTVGPDQPLGARGAHVADTVGAGSDHRGGPGASAS